MKIELNSIIVDEIASVNKLLEALENQHSCLIKSDAITLESCVKEIEECNRGIAALEMKRRQLTNGRAMSEIIEEIGDRELEDNFRSIKRLLEETKLQKDTNDLLIKQGLGYTNRILAILNPSRAPKTYNSYGKVSK
ncbi:flagellar protein FlgN [Clostridium swellfunianum]|uniref:flagellar protein FlgN n=1 Tax=Clostridium swellfunianum TaxID=1367462 RepID=UPI00202DF76B|nr:flagellar protein FlgN [Clostridium swellfunianum]MCM0650467.1 flagellar protein FlgN [Clostridium swellfunianum]